MNTDTTTEAIPRASDTPAKPAAERYLTISDICQRLQCSRTSAWRMIAEHRLPAVRIGRLVRVRESALAEWLQKHEAGGNAQQSSAAS